MEKSIVETPIIYLNTNEDFNAPYFIKFNCYIVNLNNSDLGTNRIVGICIHSVVEGLMLREVTFDESVNPESGDYLNIGRYLYINWSSITSAVRVNIKVEVVNLKNIGKVTA